MKKFFSIAMVFIFVLLAVSCDGGSSEKYDDKDLINQDDDASLNDDSISDDDSEKADGDAKEEVGDGDLGKTDEGGTTGDDDEVEVGDDDGFSSGGKPADNPPEEEIVETLPDLETGVCQVKTGNAFKLIKGNILASDKTYIGGQLLISDKGMILCVGSDCDSKPEAKKATVITCPKGVVTPAFINAHDHLGYVNNKPGNWKDERYEHRHEWRIGSNGHAKISTEKGATEEQKQWAELRQIMSGTVSIAGSGGATGLMRNLDQNCVKREGLGGIDVNYSTFPLGDSKGTMLESGCEYGDNKDKINKLECDCYLPHVAEGINQAARNEFLCLSGQEGGVDLTESNSAFIHLVGLVASDGEELAANQTALIWSPRTNVSLYGNTAPVTMFDNQGVLIGLGTDWLPSGSMNMLRELACVDYLNAVHFAKHFSDYQIWKMATLNNAFALRILDVVGAIRVGLAADIAIFDGTDAANFYRAVIAGHEKRVSLVLRGGEPLYGDENVISALDTANVCDSLKVCGVDKKVCVSDTGKNFEELKNKNAGMYPLFFCDVPEGEPTCVPQRTRPQDESRPYSGPTETDSDGDGIDDEEDNCPDIFNPIRPIDNLVQADADGDGVGDACDPCPLLKDSENCVVADINDRDGDGVLNAEDNCPFDANADQADGDGDGVGDACDACPNIANFLGAPCPTTIYEIKREEIAPGTLVRVEGIATAVKGKNFFMQVDPKDHDPTLKEKFSGIYLFKSPVAVNIGDKIAATGTVALYHGQLQIAKVSAVEITSAAKGVPDFVTVAPEKIKNGGELKDAYNGVLVKVENVTVTEGADDHNVFGVADGLKVDDDFYSYENPEIGVNFRSLSGVLAYTFNYSKILPRNAEDFGIDKCANITCDEKWSKCNPQSGECEAKEGFCAGKLDCPDEDEICDYSTHKCAPGDPCEGVICDDWAECSKITGSCVAKEGKCLNDSDCDGETSQCSPTTHECIASILKNGGFENWTDSLPDFWKGVKTNVSKSNILQETGTVRGGDAALKLQVDNKDHKRFTSKAVSLDAGSYSCEYYISGKAAEIRNSFFAATKFGSYSAYVPASAEWQKILFNFTLADAADDFEFVFSVRKTGDEKGFVIIDDLLCVKD